MKARRNPLADRGRIRAVSLEELGPSRWRHDEAPATGRELTRLFRRESAADWIGKVRPGMSLWGFSKGQFSLIDVLRHVLSQMADGAAVQLSTWTVARADLTELEELLDGKRVSELRMLLDFSFQRRQPALIHHIRETFGVGAVRVTRNHAKFALIEGQMAAGDGFPIQLVIRTSMNLNFNPRLEDIEIRDDPALFHFLDAIVADIWSAHNPREQIGKQVRGLSDEFKNFQG